MTTPISKIEVEVRYASCCNKECNNHGRRMEADSFCPKCGKEILVQSFKEVRDQNVWHRLVDTEDELSIKEDDFHIRDNKESTFSYLMCNYNNRGTHLNEDKDLEDDSPKEITSKDIQQMIDNYKLYYKNDIEAIKATYGDKASKVMFGAISFWW